MCTSSEIHLRSPSSGFYVARELRRKQDNAGTSAWRLVRLSIVMTAGRRLERVGTGSRGVWNGPVCDCMHPIPTADEASLMDSAHGQRSWTALMDGLGLHLPRV